MYGGTPEESVRSIVAVLTRAAEQRWLGAAGKSEVVDALSAARELAAKLDRIGDRYLDWDALGTADTGRLAREYWSSLDAGVLGGDGLVQLTAMSPLLTSLYRSGLNLISMCKFSDEDRRFSEAMTERFDQLATSWQWLKRHLSSQQQLADWATCRVDELGDISSMLRLCVQHRIVRSFEAERKVWHGGESSWHKVKPADIPYLLRGESGRQRGSSPARVRVHQADTTRYPLLTGNWFTALAAAVLEDQLNRLGKDREVYTMVQFAAPPEIVGRGRGDFDVLAKAGGEVLLVECKSGRLTGADYAALEQHASKLRSVFTATGVVDDVHFLLVVNPQNTGVDDAAKAAPSYVVIPPQGLRKAVTSCLGGPSST